jgi:chorismate--pyruvate lyase
MMRESRHGSRVAHPAQVARWHTHVNALHVSAQMADWLRNRASLTARLVAHSQQFRVQRLQQGIALCAPDECAQIYPAAGWQHGRKALAREVILRCDEQAVVYAHTVMPLQANASQWPRFAGLGEKSLGSTLFSDPLVARGALSFARLPSTHRFMRRIRALQLYGAHDLAVLYARRSVFRRQGASLLVTEVFLPGLRGLGVQP